MFTTGIPHMGLAFFSAASTLVAVPTSVQVFAWIGTLWKGRPELHLPMLWILAFFATFVIGEAYRGHWLADFGSRHQPFAGVDTLLGELAAEGYLLAVATAKSRRGLTRDLERTGLGRHFVASRTVDEAPPKPHPGMLEGLVDELGVRSERTLMIGDTAHDLQMAANAGTEAVAVLGGSQERDELAAAPHLAILAGAFELPGWLAGTVTLANRS
jgi:phosphoglycolate phosphatase-like HAD superfamily hydrolase